MSGTDWLDQVLANLPGVERLTIAEINPGYVDLVVEGELMDDAERRMVARRHQLGELRARSDLDLVGEPADDLAEHADLVVAVAARDQEIRRVPQRPRTTFVAATRDRVVQILQKRFRSVHGEPQFLARRPDRHFPAGRRISSGTHVTHQTREFGKTGNSLFPAKIR